MPAFLSQIVFKKLSKLIPLTCFCLLLFYGSLTAQNNRYKEQKYGLFLMQAPQATALYTEAEESFVLAQDLLLMGVFWESLYTPDFGLMTSLVNGNGSSVYAISDDPLSELKVNSKTYHLGLGFLAYTSKNSQSGFSNVFEASLGYYYSTVTLKSDSFFHFNKKAGHQEILLEFKEKINVSFVTAAFIYKMDFITRQWGIRLGGGIIYGSSVDSVDYDLVDSETNGQLKLHTYYDTSFVITAGLYSF